MPFETIQQELLRAFLTLVAGLAVARVGLYFFFRQKEYETVKQRYLEQSVDLIASELESITWAFSHNWARALDILRLYRDVPHADFEPSELKTGFQDFRATNFHQIAHHRLSVLLQSNIIWDLHQLTLSRLKSLNTKVTIEFVQGVRLHHSGSLSASHEDFINESSEFLRPLSDESDRYAHVLRALQVIATELEKSQLRFKDVANFHKRKAVKDAIDELKTHFAEELSRDIA